MNVKITWGRFYGALIVALSAWILQSFLLPLLVACVTAIASWPLYRRFNGSLAPVHAAKRDFSDLHVRDDCVRVGTIGVCRGCTGRS